MNKSLIFFGNERLATGVGTDAPVLKSLIRAGYNIAALVVNQSDIRSRQQRLLEVAGIAKQHRIEIISSDQVTTEKLKSYQTSAGILVAYGRIVPKEIIDVFERGIINIHPSLLPKYRGSTPIEQVILDGVNETGVSLMSLEPKMDAGPVWAQAQLDLSGNETKQELADDLLKIGSDLLIKMLPAILDGSATAREQDERQATFTKQLSKADGQLDLSKPAEQLEREIRALAGWPKCHVNVYGKDIIITQARTVSHTEDAGLVLACHPGFLEVQHLIAPSGRSMSGADFIRGYRN